MRRGEKDDMKLDVLQVELSQSETIKCCTGL